MLRTPFHLLSISLNFTLELKQKVCLSQFIIDNLWFHCRAKFSDFSSQWYDFGPKNVENRLFSLKYASTSAIWQFCFTPIYILYFQLIVISNYQRMEKKKYIVTRRAGALEQLQEHIYIYIHSQIEYYCVCYLHLLFYIIITSM